MKRVMFGFIFIFVLAYISFAQTEKAQQFDDLGDMNCEIFLLRSDMLFNKLEENPTSITYLIFYEGKHIQSSYNKKTKQYENKHISPKYGEARSKAKAITSYLIERRKMLKSRFILIDGGYRQNYSIEIWIAQRNSSPPRPSPDLSRKDMKFKKGKAPKIGDCAQDF